MPRLSLRAAGTAAGCRHSYLSKLIKEHRLVRGDDGLVELDDVLALLAKNDPAQRRKPPVTKSGHQPVTPVTTTADAKEAVELIAEVLRSEGIASDGPPDIQAARLAETILKARDRALRIDERRKKLVPLDLTTAQISKAFIAIRQTFQRMPSRYVPEMAARLSVEPALLQTELDKMIHTTLTELSAPVIRV